jgi:uncharacterized protein (TIGR03435 family)
MQRTAAAVCLIFGTVSLPAQHAQTPTFDVASVKVDDVDQSTFDYVPRRSGDRVTMHNTQLRMIVAYAYHIPNSSWQVVGDLHLPENRRWYDIEAIATGSPDDEDLRLMFQSLLRDRFKLKVHREVRDTTGYDLVLAKGGSKLHLAVPDRQITLEGQSIDAGTGKISYAADGAHLIGKASSIGQLIFALSGRLRAPVRDRTGLTGLFDYDVVFARDESASDIGGAPAMTTALQEELGLRLEKNRTKVDVIVIDHVESPSAN